MVNCLLGILTILSLASFIKQEDCIDLPNGKYAVHFTRMSTYKDYQVKIDDSSFVQYFNRGDSITGKITWLYKKCLFRLGERTKKDTLTGLLKTIYDSWGEPCIELKQIKDDTIQFRTTYPGNLHITTDEGYFIRIKE